MRRTSPRLAAALQRASEPSRLALRLLVGAAVGVLVAGLSVGPAAAAQEEPSASTSADASASAGGGEVISPIGPQTPGEVGCVVPQNLDEITGIYATAAGLAVIEGGREQNDGQIRISTLDASCAATVTSWTGPDPFDPRDLTVGADGSFWICDCGDEDGSRSRIAVEKAPQGGGEATIYRFKYPAGALNAEAMLLGANDLPIILAQETGGKIGIYSASAMPAANSPDEGTEGALTRVGEWAPMQTGTPNSMGVVGEAVVTGANHSPDRTKVVVRTYSDAYEYEVTNGDVVAALTTDTPDVTPLPNEPKGEAITYTADGTKFITLSDWPDSANTPPNLLTYARYEAPDPPPSPTGQVETGPAEGGGFLSNFSFNELTRIIAAVGVVGLVLAIAGIIGIRRARRRREEEDDYDYDDDYDDDPRPRRRGRGRGRDDDDHGYGVREPAYSGGYDDRGGYGGYDQYGGGQQGYDQYGGQQQGYDQYGGQQQGYDQYGGQQQGYDQYGGQQGYDQYGGQQGYGQQGYDQYGGQGQQGQYGGYGYDDDFDPMQDPRRR